MLEVGGAGEARADRVDEDKVGYVEERLLVVHDLKGRLGSGAVSVHLAAPGAEGAHMQPDGGGAWAAVVDEDNGAALFVFHAAFFVVGEEDLGFDLALVLVLSQKERAGRGGIVELGVSQLEGVLGRYSFLFLGNGRIFDFFFVFHKCPLFNESGEAHEGYGQ